MVPGWLHALGKTQQSQGGRPLGRSASGIATRIPCAADWKSGAIARSSFAGRVRTVNTASVIQACIVARVLIGIAIKLQDILRTTTVDMTQTNFEIAEARWHDCGAAGLSRVVEVDGDIVGRSITKTR